MRVAAGRQFRGMPVANRSYLYSTNVVPGQDADKSKRRIVGISEWNYDIPLVFRLLASGGTRTCRSVIWDNPDEIALLGDYAEGVARLRAFLKQIELPAAQPLIQEALAFLDKESNRNTYFLLECGEIFDMEETPLAAQNAQLLHGMSNLHAETESILAGMRKLHAEQAKSAGLIARLFGAKPPKPADPKTDPLQPLRALGLGYWSNVLYFDFSKP